MLPKFWKFGPRPRRAHVDVRLRSVAPQTRLARTRCGSSRNRATVLPLISRRYLAEQAEASRPLATSLLPALLSFAIMGNAAVTPELEEELKKLVRPVKGFPNPDFVFGDITPLLADGAAFGKVIDAFAARYKDIPDLVAIAAPEARGFFFGPPVAKALGVGFIPIRKKDQLPGETHKSDLVKMDYGERCMEVHSEVLPGGKTGKVVIVDDILATGGSAIACCGILEKLGMTVHEIAAVYDYSDGASLLPGRDVLTKAGYSVFALAKFCDDRVEGSMTWWLERGPDSDVVTSPHMGKINKQH